MPDRDKMECAMFVEINASQGGWNEKNKERVEGEEAGDSS